MNAAKIVCFRVKLDEFVSYHLLNFSCQMFIRRRILNENDIIIHSLGMVRFFFVVLVRSLLCSPRLHLSKIQ